MNPEAAGTVYPDVPFTVDPARVAAFRDLFGQTEGVPPTFPAAAEFAVFPQVIADPRLGMDFGSVVHSSQEYTYERPLRVGERLAVRTRIDSIRVRAGNAFLTIVTELFDDDGALVATARSTMYERGAE